MVVVASSAPIVSLAQAKYGDLLLCQKRTGQRVLAVKSVGSWNGSQHLVSIAEFGKDAALWPYDLDLDHIVDLEALVDVSETYTLLPSRSPADHEVIGQGAELGVMYLWGEKAAIRIGSSPTNEDFLGYLDLAGDILDRRPNPALTVHRWSIVAKLLTDEVTVFEFAGKLGPR